MPFRRTRQALLVLALAGALAGCPAKTTLTDADVVRYVKAYRALRVAAPEVAGELQKGGAPKAADLAKLDAAVKSAGFKDMAEFVKVNAAVGWAFSQAKGGQALGDADAAVKRGVAELDRQLANPAIPEATKEQLREQKEQMLATYKHNKGWADWTMGLAGALTDEASVAVVRRHAKEIEAAYLGK